MKKQFLPLVQCFAPGAFKKAIPLICVLLMVLMSNAAFSQEKVSLTGIQKDTDTTVWHTIKTTGAVTVSYQFVSCGPADFVHFRISNSSAQKVAVSWKYKQYNNGTQRALIDDLAKVNYTLDAGASVKGACGSEQFKLSLMTGEEGLEKILTDIELWDLTVNIQ